MEAFTDYYNLLGVEVDASPDAIKAAFKKLALRYHPDVYKGDDAHERMRVLLLAYQVLNDPEERRRYDVLRSEHLMDKRAPSHTTTRQGASVRPMSAAGNRSAQADVSPKARRDRQRRYAFPDFRQGQPMHIDLVDIAYTLTASEAYSLVRHGLLRGSRPEGKPGSFFCHRCYHSWRSEPAADGLDMSQNKPRYCPRCQAYDWSEYLLLRCVHCAAIFESEQIRYKIGDFTYGKAGNAANPADLCPPYELFPLCPYCGTARWSPAEDERVQELRLRAESRASILRLVWIGVIVAMIALFGVMAFTVLR